MMKEKEIDLGEFQLRKDKGKEVVEVEKQPESSSSRELLVD